MRHIFNVIHLILMAAVAVVVWLEVLGYFVWPEYLERLFMFWLGYAITREVQGWLHRRAMERKERNSREIAALFYEALMKDVREGLHPKRLRERGE